MTIRYELDVAIDEEATKRHNGKRPKPMRFLMGISALRALAAEGGDKRDPNGFPTSYRDVPICRVHHFDGWELRS